MALLFRNDLQTTIVPQSSVGSGTATFTRATVAKMMDFEGLIKNVLSGEVRFRGARRVQNLIPDPEALNAWSTVVGGTGTSPVVTTGQLAPDGTSTAFRVQCNIGAGTTSVDASGIRRLTGTSIQIARSVWVKSLTTSGTILLNVSDGSSGVPITTSWQRVAGAISTGTNTFDIGTRGDTGTLKTVDVLVWHPQIESVVGQTNQNPSEYVSVGVLAAPYHGANVDGVKYFSTFNGNTVASNVVTEATGAAINIQNGASYIANDTSGPFGYSAEAARTNLILQSQTFGTTWTTAEATVTADAAVAPDGTLTADKLTEDATSNVHFLTQTPTVSGVTTLSVYVKPAGCSTFYLISLGRTPTDAPSSVTTFFNLSNQTISGTPGLGTITALPNGWFRCTMPGPVTASAAQEFRIGLTPAPGTQTYQGDGTSGIYIWGAQMEVATFVSSYITTTTASVTRNADILTYASTGNIDSTVGTAYAEFTYQVSTSASPRIIGSTTGGAPLYQTPTTNTASIYDRTNILASVGTVAIDTIIKGASNWTGSTMKVVTNSGTIASGTFDGDMNMNNIRIGTHDGATVMPGTIRNVKIFDTAFSDANLLLLPTVSPAQITGASTITGAGTITI